ncbi:MAG: GNAT family N-acetyltransferase [Candidatus Bathyarchaeota archaeon]|nr:GNAT family N-acetyltransferase [Candidatus Bathyarchaeota archaeon]
MLEGRNVSLKPLEKEDLDWFTQWNNDPAYGGEYEPLEQNSLTDIEKWYTEEASGRWFVIQNKQGDPVGQIMYTEGGLGTTIGYIVHPDYRGKCFCTEAVTIMVDFLFLTKKIVRITAQCNPKNKASVKVLEKNGFTLEGIVRKAMFIRGQYMTSAVYGILREEWGKPRIL